MMKLCNDWLALKLGLDFNIERWELMKAMIAWINISYLQETNMERKKFKNIGKWYKLLHAGKVTTIAVDL